MDQESFLCSNHFDMGKRGTSANVTGAQYNKTKLFLPIDISFHTACHGLGGTHMFKAGVAPVSRPFHSLLQKTREDGHCSFDFGDCSRLDFLMGAKGSKLSEKELKDLEETTKCTLIVFENVRSHGCSQ